MSLIIATGSNLGDSASYLQKAKDILKNEFAFISESRVYKSPAVDYLNQPDFLNQVLEFELPKSLNPKQVMSRLLEIELELGRERKIDKGPRTIDLDILFWALEKSTDSYVTLPHPRLFERSFVVLPLKELPFYRELEKHFDFPVEFSNNARPIAL